MQESKKKLLDIFDKFNQYRLEPMATGDEWESYNYEPKAGHIVNAFASYRLSHPLVRWYYKIKDLFNWTKIRMMDILIDKYIRELT